MADLADLTERDALSLDVEAVEETTAPDVEREEVDAIRFMLLEMMMMMMCVNVLEK